MSHLLLRWAVLVRLRARMQPDASAALGRVRGQNQILRSDRDCALRDFGIRIGVLGLRVTGLDCLKQFVFGGVGDGSVAVFFRLIRFSECNTPFKEQLQSRFHRVTSGFHDDKRAFRQGFEFVSAHERAGCHLQELGWVVL